MFSFFVFSVFDDVKGNYFNTFELLAVQKFL